MKVQESIYHFLYFITIILFFIFGFYFENSDYMLYLIPSLFLVLFLLKINKYRINERKGFFLILIISSLFFFIGFSGRPMKKMNMNQTILYLKQSFVKRLLVSINMYTIDIIHFKDLLLSEKDLNDSYRQGNLDFENLPDVINESFFIEKSNTEDKKIIILLDFHEQVMDKSKKNISNALVQGFSNTQKIQFTSVETRKKMLKEMSLSQMGATKEEGENFDLMLSDFILTVEAQESKIEKGYRVDSILQLSKTGLIVKSQRFFATTDSELAQFSRKIPYTFK